MSRTVVLACLLLPALARGGAIDPNNPPDGRFSDEWLEIHLGGGKVGYAHNMMARDGDLIRTRTVMHMRLGRVDQAVRIEMTQHTTETLAGVPTEFGSEMNASMMKTSTAGTMREGKVTIVTSQYGMEQTQTYDYPAGALMSWGTFRESLLRGFEPGTEYAIQTYTPELRLDGSVTAVTRIGDWEEFTQDGTKKRGRRVTVTLESPIGSIEMISWVDADGMAVKAKVPVPGLGDMVLIATDQQTALGDFLPPEIFMTTVVKVGTTIDRSQVKRIKYLLRSKNTAHALGELPTTGMQQVLADKDGAVELLVTRQTHKPSDGGKKPGDLAEYLDTNLMINTADPELIALARRAGGGEKEPFALADKLRRFVSAYITKKNLNVGFATASEVCRTKEGDCSEHGVLLAALGRIHGIPSRVVAGLAYVPSFGGQRDVFGYHLWTEFFIDGRWITLDAALGETDCSPARIAMATSSLKNAGLADLSLPLISKMGAIAIDIVEIDGKPVTSP